MNDVDGFLGVITRSCLDEYVRDNDARTIPIVHSVGHVDHLVDDDIVAINSRSGMVRTLFRPQSNNNALFLTERCNNNCLMCSQPPRNDRDEEFLGMALRLVGMIPQDTANIAITGGEPTLLGNGLLDVISDCKTQLPNTNITILTNGRMFYYRSYVKRLSDIEHPHLMLAIPLYSDVPEQHNQIVRSEEAFQQSVLGIYNLGAHNQDIEVRIVLHALNFKRLPHLCEFIYRNLPFISHVAIMGMEVTGYARKNLGQLWIEPYDYSGQLVEGVEFLATRGMNVSIYNTPLCILPEPVWKYARQSISDWKTIYLEECSKCQVKDKCGGLFQTSGQKYSQHIHAVLS
jgi:His-Xaa-Ser system radical SAM maturase HxsC